MNLNLRIIIVMALINIPFMLQGSVINIIAFAFCAGLGTSVYQRDKDD